MDNEMGRLISSLRKEKNMTQQELADKLNITDKAVSKWERGVSLR
ncbi:XRE family transcriptional regulator [Anaerofustis stercorihominis]|uniref:XRE family transcriptional regulator n=1 Tax=Anaerofustis stercorihominis TaxID=214853 RepID=A0A3E3E3D4_9FIRM|nr:helix-turn-helix transcriptional regulator [Anaerofustis stercorihominis]RGD75418.1 XRE family transcriptional regulator [Anaerofustis stercorihominis]